MRHRAAAKESFYHPLHFRLRPPVSPLPLMDSSTAILLRLSWQLTAKPQQRACRVARDRQLQRIVRFRVDVAKGRFSVLLLPSTVPENG